MAYWDCKEQSHMIVSMHVQYVFWEKPTAITDKTLSQLRMEGKLPQTDIDDNGNN